MPQESRAGHPFLLRSGSISSPLRCCCPSAPGAHPGKLIGFPASIFIFISSPMDCFASCMNTSAIRPELPPESRDITLLLSQPLGSAPLGSFVGSVRACRALQSLRSAFIVLLFAVSGIAAEPRDISEELETIRNKHSLPGLAAAAVHKGELVALGATGVRKVGDKTPVTRDDKWHIGSCTKSMTATLAAMLVEDGVVKWTTTVGEAFPELKTRMKQPWGGVTLEQLLAHRSGAPGDPPEKLWREAYRGSGSPVQQRRAFVSGLLSEDPEAAPGTRFIYSNQGYAIAGAMLERLAKKPWEDLMRERVFGPLKLASAGFGTPAGRGKLNQPWGHSGDGAVLKPVPPGPAADNPIAIAPAGLVHCSIGDFARYAGWHAHRGRTKTLLSSESFSKLHQAAGDEEHAIGWMIAPRGWAGGNALSHAGSNTMWYAVMWVAPEKDAAFVAATNAGNNAARAACDQAVAALVQQVLR